MRVELWKRIRDGFYEGRAEDGKVLATVERNDQPNNSHLSIWELRLGDSRHNFGTLKDAKACAERRLA